MHLMVPLISGVGESTEADRIGGVIGRSAKSVTGNVVVAGICKEHGQGQGVCHPRCKQGERTGRLSGTTV